VFVDQPLDFVDDHRALSHQILPEVGKLPNLNISRIDRKNAANAIGTLSALQPFPVIP
jgi:hypothetical protein